MKKLFASIFSLLLIYPLTATADTQSTTLQLCSSNTTGVVVARSKCKKSETRVNPPVARFEGCYWRLGTPVSLAGKTGQVTITESCTSGDVLVNHSISHNETNNGIVQVSSIAFTSPAGASHTLPQGVIVRLNLVNEIQPPIPDGENRNAEVNLLCCPYK